MASRFVAVEPEPEVQAPPAAPSPEQIKQQQVATQMLALALRTMSQKALIAVSSLFTAAALFSAWWLWNSVLPDPSDRQLVGVGLYALFILILEFVRRR